jgi:hypothetical protein
MASTIKIPGSPQRHHSLRGECREGVGRVWYDESQNMTVGVGWKRRESEDVGTSFIASAVVQLSAHREGLGGKDGRHPGNIIRKSRPSNLCPSSRRTAGTIGDEL